MNKRHTVIHPEHFPPARGYVNGVVTSGRTLHIAGQIGWEKDETFADTAFVAQFARALDNVIDVVHAAGGFPTDVVKMTIYVTDLDAYRNAAGELGPIWRERFGKHYPAMALVGVTGLVHPQAMVEIEATASLLQE